eukprot:TRINITY_DN5435_c0_g1_i1.p1 TRINITY_DN5435_c0_g1~~TRINITY_DN5435_c0_g1_i1.p1  ORF type:complete len:427 (-),score=76.96 TRINITY_DN5435_c0_g1_i1:151-1431(-)
MIRRPPRSTLSSSSAASDVYKRQGINAEYGDQSQGNMNMTNALSLLLVCLSLSALGQDSEDKTSMFSLKLGDHISTNMLEFSPGCVGTQALQEDEATLNGDDSCPVLAQANSRRRSDGRRRRRGSTSPSQGDIFRIDGEFVYSIRPPTTIAQHTWIAVREVDDDTSWSDLFNKFNQGTAEAIDGSIAYLDADGKSMLAVDLKRVRPVAYAPLKVASRGRSGKQVTYEEIHFVVESLDIVTEKAPGPSNPKDDTVTTTVALDLFAGGGSDAQPFTNFGQITGGLQHFEGVDTNERFSCTKDKEGTETCTSSTSVTASEVVKDTFQVAIPIEGFLEDIRAIANSNNNQKVARWDSTMTIKNKDGKVLRTMSYKDNKMLCLALPGVSDTGNSPNIHAMKSSGRRRNGNRRRSLPVTFQTNFGFLEITRG